VSGTLTFFSLVKSAYNFETSVAQQDLFCVIIYRMSYQSSVNLYSLVNSRNIRISFRTLEFVTYTFIRRENGLLI